MPTILIAGDSSDEKITSNIIQFTDSLKQYMEKHGGEVEKVELKYDRVTSRMRYYLLSFQ